MTEATAVCANCRAPIVEGRWLRWAHVNRPAEFHAPHYAWPATRVVEAIPPSSTTPVARSRNADRQSG